MTIPRMLFSVVEAAEIFGMGETLFRGEILPVLPRVEVGTRVLLDVEDLRQWVNAHKAIASANRTAPARRSRSGSATPVSDESSARAQQIEARLNARLAASTEKKSREDAKVLPLARSGSRRKERAHG